MKDARLHEAKKRLEIEKRGIVHSRDVLTFEEFLTNKYEPMAQLELRGTTWKIRGYKLKPLRKHFGRLSLTKINEQHIEGYKQARTKKVAKATVNGELNVLSAVVTYAHAIKVPCASPKIRRFKMQKRKGNARAFTRTEVGFVLAACAIVAPHFFPVVSSCLKPGAASPRRSTCRGRGWISIEGSRAFGATWMTTKSTQRRTTAKDTK